MEEFSPPYACKRVRERGEKASMMKEFSSSCLCDSPVCERTVKLARRKWRRRGKHYVERVGKFMCDKIPLWHTREG